MITDILDNSALYNALHKNFAKAFEYIKNTDFSKVENGKHPIIGDEVYASVNTYTTKNITENKFEAHEKYIDIQFLASGTERLYYTPLNKTKPIGTYNTEKDYIFLEGDGDYVTAYPGMFMIFFPTDAHMPNMINGCPCEVKKVVVKVRI